MMSEHFPILKQVVSESGGGDESSDTSSAGPDLLGLGYASDADKEASTPAPEASQELLAPVSAAPPAAVGPAAARPDTAEHPMYQKGDR